MQEIYKGGDGVSLSIREIEKMKKNMKKVPIIKKKSEEFHKKQEIDADDFIEKKLIKSDYLTNKIKQENKTKQGNEKILLKLIKRFKILFKKITDGFNKHN